jgi:hypothetical protein
MNVGPATSHDYKLVMLAAPLAILLLGEVLNYAVDGGWRPIATIAFLLVLTGLLTHAYTMMIPYVVSEPGWLANRYLWILLLQGVAFVEVVAARGVFRSSIGRNSGLAVPRSPVGAREPAEERSCVIRRSLTAQSDPAGPVCVPRPHRCWRGALRKQGRCVLARLPQLHAGVAAVAVLLVVAGAVACCQRTRCSP